MRILLLALALLVLGSIPAKAGPWPREPGQVFFALSVEAPTEDGAPARRFRSYGEAGLRPRLGFAASADYSAQSQRLSAALRWHPPDLPGNVAWGLSAGLRRATDAAAWTDQRQAVLAVSIGRGFDTPLGSIWARGDLGAVFGLSPLGVLEREMELSAQIGLRNGGWIGMLAITQDRKPDSSTTSLRPALGYEFDPRLTLLGEAALSSDGERRAISLSLWSRF